MRILVDHSGYHLLNIGDVAMLQACVRRLRTLWPDAEVKVFTESLERLQLTCPGASTVAPSIVGRSGLSILPMARQKTAEQMWKTAMPLLARSGRVAARTDAEWVRPRLLQAVREADVVVSSGGGFVNDIFPWHGAGVLSVLAFAQRLGKPTAMFGQGIGPLTHPVLSRLVRRVMPRLTIIGLREGVESVPILMAHGTDRERIHVTGDDALLVVTNARRPATGSAVGLNVRVAPYSGIDARTASRIVAVTRQVASGRGVACISLPVCHLKEISDVQSIRLADSGNVADVAGHEMVDARSPVELAEHAARCRIIVTGSYHAAVFGLANGVPAVCITKSSYYDGKFHGLEAQFPGGVNVVRPGPTLERELTDAIDRAWDGNEATRDAIHSAALAQVAMADKAYERFKALAES